jgi:hypothetical protein
MRKFLAACMKPSIRWQAVKVSLFVGTLLNLINQAAPVWNGSPLSWPHLLLNYLVPFCVSSYSAAKNEIARDIS